MPSPADRRRFLTHLSGTVAGVALAGCGGGKTDASTGSTATAVTPAASTPVTVTPMTPVVVPVTPAASAPVTVVTTPPPVIIPSVPGVTAPPGVVINPATWLVAEGQVSRIPFSNTIRQSLPDFLTHLAGSFTDIWPSAAFLPDTMEIGAQNGGHMVENVGATIYSSLRYLRHEARNCAPGPKGEDAMSRNGYPDENGVHRAMHGYNGYYCRPKSAGHGNELLVLFTMYGDASPVRYYDVNPKMGGGSTFYRTGDNPDITWGGYATAVAVNFLGGAFVSDPVSANVPKKFAFIPHDMSPVQWGPPTPGDPLGLKRVWDCPVEQWGACVMTVDEENKYLYTVVKGLADASAGPLHDPWLRVTDLDASRPTFNTHVDHTFPYDRTMEPNRTGFVFLKGKGIVGIEQTSTGETRGIQIKPGARPMIDPPTVRVVFPSVPAPFNGVFGSHVAVQELGITFLNTGPDEQPLQINWPRV